MDSQKRTIILKEIEHWRRSKLLPEQYCDFLYNLYADDENEGGSTVQRSVKRIQSSGLKSWSLGFGLVGVVLLLLLNFRHFPLLAQVAISICIVIALGGYGVHLRWKKPLVSHVFIGLACVTLLLMGIIILKQHTGGQEGYLLLYILLCSILWAVLGIVLKMPVFHFCGIISLLLFYSWILHGRIESDAPWYKIQIMWLPLSLLFIWIGWLFTTRSKKIGVVYLLAGALLWFAPEMYQTAVHAEVGNSVQISFMVKLAFSASVLFIFRKKWTEWVIS
ncbi:hypothetical protein [Marinicrinis lubricantis]|uniref:DUF2157 domain-containing protein n=1 Tax=Marinicrinis lubricantis TaxID=2086470 RepID=A0ABW1IUU0_9BACL